jgi:hypothetical protein
MISLYCEHGHDQCQRIKEKLDDLALEFHYIEVDVERAGDVEQLPLLVDDGRKFTGLGEIETHIDELTRLAADWRKFQSDSCYCDDQGNVI